MARAICRKLHHALSLFHRDFDAVADKNPEVASCLRALDAAVVDSFPLNVRDRAGRRRLTFAQKLKRSENKRDYLGRRVKRLEEELHSLKYGKRGNQHRMTPEFLAKVALAWPTSCARNFHAAWQDLVGSGVAGCARPTINNIRDAFAEVVKQQSSSALSSMLAAGFRANAAAALAPEISAGSSASAEASPVLSVALAPASSMIFL